MPASFKWTQLGTLGDTHTHRNTAGDVWISFSLQGLAAGMQISFEGTGGDGNWLPLVLKNQTTLADVSSTTTDASFAGSIESLAEIRLVTTLLGKTTVAVAGQTYDSPMPVTVGGTVDVNVVSPDPLPISGSVTANQGGVWSVAVNNFPVTQPVSGTVSIDNPTDIRSVMGTWRALIAYTGVALGRTVTGYLTGASTATFYCNETGLSVVPDFAKMVPCGAEQPIIPNGHVYLSVGSGAALPLPALATGTLYVELIPEKDATVTGGLLGTYTLDLTVPSITNGMAVLDRQTIRLLGSEQLANFRAISTLVGKTIIFRGTQYR